MKKSLFFLTILAALLPACAAGRDNTPAAELAGPTSGTAVQTPLALEHIDLGVGFIPNVQFAPLYVAQAKGFYANEGLDVALEYGYENDFVALTAQGERQFAVASGDQVILARAQGLPVVYVMKWYQRFPVAVAALAETGLDAPEKLSGHSVGIPGLFGASYVAWEALVYATGLDKATINLEEIGFTQAEAISQKKVDAAVVYLTNEPVQLKQLGLEVNVIEVSDYIDLVSNGLITNETVIRENPDLVRRLVRATLRGLEYTIAHPDEAFDLARQAVPEITDEDAPAQRAVLNASLELWRSDQPGLSDLAAWAESAEFMLATGLIESPVEVETLYTNEFVGE
ncbi:MAG: ABC transporter substrate-binding protein [Anaerolineae bacterium]|nr:ABC transporter substrate-binding protein [Anaerolineae bacterium]